MNIENLDFWCYACDDNVVPARGRNEILIDLQKLCEKTLRDKKLVLDEPEEKVVPKNTNFTVTTPGLYNLGNTCYFNSVVQVLASTEPLLSVQIESQKPLTLAFTRLLEKIGNSVSTSPISPKELFSALGGKYEQFVPHDQQDAHELLRFLFEGLKSEETESSAELIPQKRPRRRTLVSATSEEVELENGLPSNPPKGWVDEIFGGKTASIVVCDFCKSISTTWEDFQDIAMSIKTNDKVVLRKRDRLRSAFKRTPSVRFSRVKNQGNISDNGAMSDIGPQIKYNDSPQLRSFDDTSTPISQRIGNNQRRLAKLTLEDEYITPKALVVPNGSIPQPSQKRLDYIKMLMSSSEPVQKSENGTALSIQDCLKEFTSVEVLDGDNKFACEECAKFLYPRQSRRQKGSLAAAVNSSSDDNNSNPVRKSRRQQQKEQDQDHDHDQERDESMSKSSCSPSLSSSPESEAVRNKSGVRPKFLLRKAYKRILFQKPLPKVLVFHLKRFQSTGRGFFGSLKKVDDMVKFDDIIDMAPFVTPNTSRPGTEVESHGEENASTIFQLSGVVVHVGTLHGGHYVCYFRTYKTAPLNSQGNKSNTREWVFASDSQVRPASAQEVSKARAYLLFYERID